MREGARGLSAREDTLQHNFDGKKIIEKEGQECFFLVVSVELVTHPHHAAVQYTAFAPPSPSSMNVFQSAQPRQVGGIKVRKQTNRQRETINKKRDM